MSRFKKRPQFSRLEYVSPPETEVLHANPEEDLTASERAAKRRRIEDYARGYLKGRDIFISTASLRGPFNTRWDNPWKRGASSKHAKWTNVRHVPTEQVPARRNTGITKGKEAEVVEKEQLLTAVGIALPEREARPVSRASSDYCHDWLRKQRDGRCTRDLDDEFDVEVREGDPATPSKQVQHKRGGPLARNHRSGRPSVVPAWTADHPERVTIHSDILGHSTQFNSLQVDVGSSVAKRSASEKPVRNPYRGILGTRTAVEDDPTLTKVSLIRDDRSSQKRSGPLPRTQAKLFQDKNVDSPGFPFRRVAESKQPINRGSDNSKPSTTEPDHNDLDAQVSVPVADVNAVDNQAPDGLNKSEEEEESVTIYINDEGKWPCPMADCPKRPKPYTRRSGVRVHLKNKHNVYHTRTDPSRSATALPHKSTSGTKKIIINRPPEVALAMSSASKGTTEEPSAGLGAPVANGEGQVVQTSSEEESMKPEPVMAASYAATIVDAVPIGRKESTASKQPKVPDVVSKSNIAPANGKGDVVAGNCDEVRRTETNNSSKTSGDAPPNKSATDPPDRQNSRAYSTFTFNLEMSTQAALLRAHQAFQDTQSPEKANEKESANVHVECSQEPETPQGVTSKEAATPFRRPGIPSFFSRAPESITRPVPVSTQDIMNAAADLTFSTVKKPTTKKRISFTDWPQAKPSQATRSMKPVEWSPFIETPSSTAIAKQQKSYLQSEETPVRAVQAKSSLSFTKTGSDIPTTTPQQFAQPKSSTAARNTPSAPSEFPILNYQEAQGYGSQEIENALDDAMSFLSTWDVDKEIDRNNVRRSGESALKT